MMADKGFQFLIGTLKTRVYTQTVKHPHEFQFLIGTLKTSSPTCLFLACVLVSIPHRYAKNKVIKLSALWQNRVSIPHRYAKNLL